MYLGQKPTKVIQNILSAQSMEQFRGGAYRVFSNYKRLRLANKGVVARVTHGRSNK